MAEGERSFASKRPYGWGFSKGEGFVALPARQAYSGVKVAAEIGWGNGGIEINASPTGSGHF